MLGFIRKATTNRDAATLESVKLRHGAGHRAGQPSDRAAEARDRAQQRAFIYGIRH